MKRTVRNSVLLALTGLPVLLAPAYAETITLVAKLIGANESPPVNTPGTGSAGIVLNPALNTMNVGISFRDLLAGTTASHIHCCLPSPFQTGVNVGVATTTPTFPGFPLGVRSGTYSASFNLLDAATYNPAFVSGPDGGGSLAGARNALVAGILSDRTYLNIHSTLFPNGEIRGFVVPVSGEVATGAQQGAFQLMNGFLTLMLDPFVYGRGGIGADGPAMAYAPDPKTLPADVAGAFAADLKARPAAPRPVFYDQRWTMWGGAYGGVSRTRGDLLVDGTNDLHANAVGFAAGADYRLSPDTVLGFALGGGGTNWNIAQGLGNGRSDAFQAGVYGISRFGQAYIGASFGYAEHWLSTTRTTVLFDTFKADFNGHNFGGRVESGYRYTWPAVAITPYAALQAQAFERDAYTEGDPTGTGLNFGYADRTSHHTRSELGSRFDRTIALDATSALSLRAKAAWAHDWVSDPGVVTVFQSLPGPSFIIDGATPARNLALVSAGGELRYTNGWSIGAKFDGEFASGTQTYGGSGYVRYHW
jgi:outer membrane autotransporter protein